MFDGSNLLLRGIALISLGAFIDGSLGLALKYLKRWKWEHLWLVYSVLAFSVIPWILGFGTIKNLPRVLQIADSRDLLLVFVFGLAWGCGAVFFGLSLKMAGMALSYAIAVGLGAAVGSFAPLVLLHRQNVYTQRGGIVIGGVLLVIIGVALCSWAGHLKDRRLALSSGDPLLSLEPDMAARWKLDLRVRVGVVIAILSGLLNPMINMSLAYGAPIARLAEAGGTQPFLALNVIWAIAMSAGALVNAAYCAYVISKGQTWHLMSWPSSDYLIGLTMGLLGPVGLLLYGIGSSRMGDLAEVVGWPILCSMGILSANFWGAVTGEWSGIGRKPLLVMGAAIVVLISAMFILGWSSTLG
jgi:L-rhamnose-H+ transport protein